ncbi:ATP-grasp domain-containing protein [Metabacillus herbersteinensis]|uniref:ATP-grasp domain-containing protein n=1 Tax=Metabacillus herbersteinensis TaxID=283816 RepID=A0ABV6GE12_9BACI
MKDGNVLVTSISSKVPLIKAIKKAAHKINPLIKVIGADLHSNCIARYFVDRFWQMPRLDDIKIDQLIQYCLKNKIIHIIPTRDGELKFFAEHKKKLKEDGIYVMVPNNKSVEMCNDKYLFYKKLSVLANPVITTKTAIDQIKSLKFVVKERFGAGSQNIGLGLSSEEAFHHAKKLEYPIFQPYIDGFEVSVDFYVTKEGEVKGIITRKREMIVNGESQITTTFRDDHLERLCEKAANDLQLYGHNVMQWIIDLNGDYHMIECNSRFGGASTLSVAAGLDSLYWFLLEARGKDLKDYPFIREKHEIKLVRYAEDLIL